MNYYIELLIDLPRDRVLELFQDMEFMKKWQDGFISLDVIEGNPGEIGSKSKLIYNMRGKETTMIETILKKDLPNQFDFSYEAKGVYNIVNNTFIDNGKSTLWKAEHTFRFTGIMAFMSLFMKKLFIKQTTEDMTSFKTHAEAE